jgi:hypothetical protein
LSHDGLQRFRHFFRSDDDDQLIIQLPVSAAFQLPLDVAVPDCGRPLSFANQRISWIFAESGTSERVNSAIETLLKSANEALKAAGQ